MKTATSITFAIALLATAPAAASTLVLYDAPADQARRVFDQIYPEQTIERQVRLGMLRPITVPIGEDGVRRTTVVEVLNPGPPVNFGPGYRVLRERLSWQITAERVGDQISYEAVLVADRGFEGGLGTPRDVTSNEVRLVGVAPVQAPGPSFMREYAMPTGRRVLVGYVRD